jgi:exopolysaccharide biosynthesis polyprenyl glycosylphosphotransferase
LFTKKAQLSFSGILIITDALIISASFLFSFWFRFHSGLMTTPKGIPPLQPYFIASIVVALLWVIIFWMVGLYESRQVLARDEEIYRVAKGTVVGLVAIMAFSFFYREVVWSRLVLGMSTITAFLLLSLERSMAVAVYRSLMKRYGMGMKRAALIGNGETAERILEHIISNPQYGYQIKGLVGIEGYCAVTRRDGLLSLMLEAPAELSELIDRQELDTLFIVLPNEKQRQVVDIVSAVEHRPIELKFVPDLADIISHDTSVSQLGDVPLINLRVVPISDWDLVIKRGFDMFCSVLALVLLLPLLLLLALLVKLTSPGPVFYSQERVGYDGKTFLMHKFRSMRTGAEDKSGPVWAKQGDPRRTPFGSFIRRYSLDELPQFFNVLKGDMSLVGPRPERPFFVEQFKSKIPRYASRHKVKSGVTGWAQVNGLRGDTSIIERTKYDIYYIEHWSLLMDIKILFKTVIQVMFPSNAY